VNVVGVLMAIVIAASPSPSSTDWTITPVFGPAISAPGTSANPALVPGQSSTSGYLITHTDAIHGPLDVSASSTDAVSSFEDHLLVTVAVNGVAGQTKTLGQLLRHSGVVRGTTALPSGPAMLTVTVELDPASTSVQRLRLVDFTLFVTVSDEVVPLAGPPNDPIRGLPGLPITGQTVSLAAILLGGLLIVGGTVLVLRRRRRRPVANIAQATD
jgi:LPXTG-motif cell wall-anchored protein